MKQLKCDECLSYRWVSPFKAYCNKRNDTITNLCIAESCKDFKVGEKGK
jgi:hypothetical protein